MTTTQLTGNEILEILDNVVETEGDYYSALDQMDYLVSLAETAKAELAELV